MESNGQSDHQLVVSIANFCRKGLQHGVKWVTAAPVNTGPTLYLIYIDSLTQARFSHETPTRKFFSFFTISIHMIVLNACDCCRTGIKIITLSRDRVVNQDVSHWCGHGRLAIGRPGSPVFPTVDGHTIAKCLSY